MNPIPERIYFRIGEVARISGVKPHVIRYWETEFPSIVPEKSRAGQRVYRRSHVETVLLIKHLLYQERYSIEGARRKIRELKKDGDLKNYKSERVLASGSNEARGGGTADPKTRGVRVKRARQLMSELKTLLDQSMQEVFQRRN